MALTGDFRKYMDKSFLGSWDVPDDGDLILTIDHVQREDVKNDRGTEKKLTIHFKERDYKPMICNVTNGKFISAALGSSKVEDWAGRKIAIYRATISAFNETIECLRVRNYPPKESELICADCGCVIEDHTDENGKTYRGKAIANNALTKFGRFLCWDCARSEKERVADNG